MSKAQCHCDHCDGVEWPAPKHLTNEQYKEITKIFNQLIDNMYLRLDTAIQNQLLRSKDEDQLSGTEGWYS